MMRKTITLANILDWLESLPDERIVGKACDTGDCVVARYAKGRYRMRQVHTEDGMTFFGDRHRPAMHDSGVRTLIERMDEDAVATGDYDLTAGMVREVSARIIRQSQPQEEAPSC